MKYSIEKLDEPITYIDSQTKEKKILTGYAFIGEHGITLIIAWGENRRDLLIKYFDTFI